MRPYLNGQRAFPALFAMAGLALAAMGASACCNMKENAAATKACASMANSTACKSCCGSHGSRTNAYLSGKCTCY